MRTALLFAVASVAAAGTTDDGVSEEAYVEFGKKFSGFVRMVVVVEADGSLAAGSCVLLGPRVAMTAAHIVNDAVGGSVGENRIVEFVCHPEYTPKKPFHADLAILRCKEDFGSAYYPRWTAQRHNVGTRVMVAGFGATGRMSTGASVAGGTLLAGTQTIHRLEPGLLICKNERGSSPLEYGLAAGDSGGPVFAGSGSSATLAGINSLRLHAKDAPAAGLYGESTAHTEVAAFAEWIEGVLEGGR